MKMIYGYKNKILILTIACIVIGATVLPIISGNCEFSGSTEIENIYSGLINYYDSFNFSRPKLTPEGGFVELEIEGADSYTSNPGEPTIPIFNKIIEFPLGTKIIGIKCTFSSHETIDLNKKITPSQEPVSDKKIIDISDYNMLKKDVYESTDLYPTEEYSYRLGGGLSGENHVTFLSIHLYPVRYLPSLNKIKYAKNVSIEVSYKKPLNTMFGGDGNYNFIIITPSEFYDNLQPLVTHKETHGISTKICTVEEINGEGRDRQEQIKYFIKDAIEKWGTHYVLLVGNKDKVPVRYSNYTQKGKYSYAPFISDLYYADVFDSNMTFCSWDSNDNGKFGELEYDSLNNTYKVLDEVDLYPDVYMGRLLCLNTFEVDSIVNKIITYETNTANQQWFNNLVLCGGNSANINSIEILTGGITWEGEYVCNAIAEIMSDFNPIKLYASANLLFLNFYNAEKLSSNNINKKINDGAGFVLFSGHGTQTLWGTHPPIFVRRWIKYKQSDLGDLHNGEKMPFVVLDGCLCGDYSKVDSPIAWEFVKLEHGGSIASIASTSATWFYRGRICNKFKSGYFVTQFFDAFSRGYNISGNIFGCVQTSYLNHVFSDYNPGDYQNVEGFTLFGDPTLMIGGYKTEYLKPVANAGGKYSERPGEIINFDGSDSFDPDGIITSYSWDFGDGYNGSGMKCSHSYDQEGTYTIVLTVTDNDGLTDTNITTVIVDLLDQYQTEEGGYGMAYYESYWCAQSFIPEVNTLTRVELKMFRFFFRSEEILTTVSIRDSLNGDDLAKVSLTGDKIPNSGWVEFDFNDLTLVPLEKYYIVCRADGGDAFYHFDWYFEIDDPYLKGEAWFSNDSGASWSEPSSEGKTNRDFCFKAYGLLNEPQIQKLSRK